MSYFSDVERDLVVVERTALADDIVAFDLASPNGRDLPAWTPGSHLDVILPDADGTGPVERQYSLCGDTAERGRWRIAVLRETGGRGGSVRVHDELAVGTRVRVRGPRNHFPFDVSPGTRYRFVAGGIGFYDGFFGPGAGSFFALALVTLMGMGLTRATAHTKALNFSSNLVSVVVFAIGGHVLWAVGLIMAAGQVMGGWMGSHAAMRFGPRLIRPLLVVICIGMVIKLLSDPANPLRAWSEGLI